MKKIKRIAKNIYICCVLIIVGVMIMRDNNIALSMLLCVFFYIDYQIWLRGGNSIFFEDKTKIEKDLRRLQKLDIKNRIENEKGRCL